MRSLNITIFMIPYSQPTIQRKKRNDETKDFDCCLHSRPMLEGENRSWPVVSGHLPLNIQPVSYFTSSQQSALLDQLQWCTNTQPVSYFTFTSSQQGSTNCWHVGTAWRESGGRERKWERERERERCLSIVLSQNVKIWYFLSRNVKIRYFLSRNAKIRHFLSQKSNIRSQRK